MGHDANSVSERFEERYSENGGRGVSVDERACGREGGAQEWGFSAGGPWRAGAGGGRRAKGGVKRGYVVGQQRAANGPRV